MHILWIVLVVLGVIWGLLRLLMQFNKILQSGRTHIWILVLGLIALGWAFVLIEMQFIKNKGPNDLGAYWHVAHALSEKYENSRVQASYDLKSFDKDADGSSSGTYHIHFKYNDHAGMILCHYDKATGKFDQDEIDPDK